MKNLWTLSNLPERPFPGASTANPDRDAPSAALYSSADEVKTTDCVEDHVLNGCQPNITKPPDVDRCVRHPAQSLSVNTF